MRRTDKIGSEAAFHSLEEYMVEVERFFDLYEQIRGKPMTRNVYLASDEVTVLKEAKEK